MSNIRDLDRFLNVVTDGAYGRAVASRKSAPAGPDACVYGAGRGRFDAEKREWVAEDFHCSSFTAWLAGVAVSRDEAWDNRGTLAPLDRLLETVGEWTRTDADGRVYRGQGYGEAFERLGKKTETFSGQAALDRLHAGGEGLVLAAQTTRQASGRWKWEHHTVALIVRDGLVFRIAADGYKGKGGYSGTPMDCEVFSPDPAKVKFRFWRLKASHLRVSDASARRSSGS